MYMIHLHSTQFIYLYKVVCTVGYMNVYDSCILYIDTVHIITPRRTQFSLNCAR